MTLWNPVWKITIDGVEYQNITLANMSITSGRTDYYAQPQAGYCNLEIVQLNNQSLPITINSALTVSVQKSTGAYVAIFGGSVSDYIETVKNAGSKGTITSVQITALGALAKLQTALTYGVLTKDYDGNQIKKILQDALPETWSSVSPATTWATYPATTIWADVQAGSVGTIDTGSYELQARTSSQTDAYSLIAERALSGMGYVFEDSNGLINYDDVSHRGNYLAANGYVNLTGNQALWQGIRTSLRGGNVRNKISLLWRAGTETSSNTASIASYGTREAQISTVLHNQADAISQVSQYLQQRAYPQAVFDQITFPITSSEIDDSDRDALIGIFMGMPVQIDDLPSNISNGQFQGFVEGWSWRVGYNSVYLTFNTSTIAFSTLPQRWNQVSASKTWSAISGTLTWLKATGTVA